MLCSLAVQPRSYAFCLASCSSRLYFSSPPIYYTAVYVVDYKSTRRLPGTPDHHWRVTRTMHVLILSAAFFFRLQLGQLESRYSLDYDISTAPVRQHRSLHKNIASKTVRHPICVVACLRGANFRRALQRGRASESEKVIRAVSRSVQACTRASRQEVKVYGSTMSARALPTARARRGEVVLRNQTPSIRGWFFQTSSFVLTSSLHSLQYIDPACCVSDG